MALTEAEKARVEKLRAYALTGVKQFTLKKLSNMQFKVDWDNVIRYVVLRGGLGGLKARRHVLGALREGIRTRGTRRGYMRWDRLAEIADALNIPAELLVDEDYYFKRWGLAGWRLLFEARRRGVSLEELVRPSAETSKDHVNHWYSAVYWLFKGGTYTNHVQGADFQRLMRLCNERMGIPVGELVAQPLHSRRKESGILGDLADTLSALGNRECAFLAGVARALLMKQVGRKDFDFAEEMDNLMRWYSGGEKRREEPDSESVAGDKN